MPELISEVIEMKKILALLLVSAVLLSVVGCTNPPTTTPIIKTTPVGTPVSFNVVKGDAPRVTSPNVTDNQLSTLVN